MDYPICIHGKILINPSGYLCCNDCYDAYLKQENVKWAEKQRMIFESYQNWQLAKNIYIAICGNPIERG